MRKSKTEVNTQSFVIQSVSWPGTEIFGLIHMQVCHVEQLGTELCQNPGDGHKVCLWPTAVHEPPDTTGIIERFYWSAQSAVVLSFCHFLGAIYSFVVFCDQTLQTISAWSEGNMILQNVRNHLASDTASHPKRLESSILEVLSHLWLQSMNIVQKTDTCSYFSFVNIGCNMFCIGILLCRLEFLWGCFHETVEVLKYIVTMLSAV